MAEKECARCKKMNTSYTAGISICPGCEKIIKEKQDRYKIDKLNVKNMFFLKDKESPCYTLYVELENGQTLKSEQMGNGSQLKFRACEKIKEREYCVDIGMGCGRCGYTGLNPEGDGPCYDCLDYPDFGFCEDASG